MKRPRTSRHAITSTNRVHYWILFVKEIDSRTPSACQVRSTATAKKRKSPPRAIVERMASALAHATFSKVGVSDQECEDVLDVAQLYHGVVAPF